MEYQEWYHTNDLEILEILIVKDIHNTQYISSSIDYNIKHNHLDALDFLLNKLTVLRVVENLSSDSIMYLLKHNKIKTNDFDYVFYFGCKNGFLDVIKFITNEYNRQFIDNTVCNIPNGVYEVFKHQHHEIIRYLDDIDMYTNITILNRGLAGACCSGQHDLIEFIINKGANDWNTGLIEACYNNHIHVAELMISYGANNFNECLENTRNNDMILLMLKNGATDIYSNIEEALERGNKDLIFLITQNTSKWPQKFNYNCDISFDTMQYYFIQIYQKVNTNSLINYKQFNLMSVIDPKIDDTFMSESNKIQLLNHNIEVEQASRLYHKQRNEKCYLVYQILFLLPNVKLFDKNIVNIICKFIPFSELEIRIRK